MTILNHANTKLTFINYRAVDPKESTCDKKFISYDLQRMKQTYISAYDVKINRWLKAMDLYDKDITAHTLRVTALSLELARFMGLGNDELAFIQYGTLLHDIGKLGIPNTIIHKPSKLSAYEYRVVQQHPLYAHEWIKKGDDYHPAKVIPLYHHEKWNGMGYPFGLKGKEIPLLARIVAVVDVWDAVTSDRPYRKAMSNERAIDLIYSESGNHFEPEIVDAFLQLGVYEAQRLS